MAHPTNRTVRIFGDIDAAARHDRLGALAEVWFMLRALSDGRGWIPRKTVLRGLTECFGLSAKRGYALLAQDRDGVFWEKAVIDGQVAYML